MISKETFQENYAHLALDKGHTDVVLVLNYSE